MILSQGSWRLSSSFEVLEASFPPKKSLLLRLQGL